MKRQIHFIIATAVGIGAAQADISIHGSSTNYTETGGNWLTMGVNDIDGSGGLGSDGWIFFGDFNGSSQGGQPFSLHVKSTPSYIGSFSQGANFLSIAEDFSGYGQIDNPNLLNGSNQTAGFALATTGSAGASNEVVTFTVTSLPAGTTARVGVLAGIESNTDGRWDPTSITLTEGANSAAVGNHVGSPLPANPGNSNTGWAFFNIDSNGTYQVFATKRLSGQGVGIGGLTFDSVASSDLADPTSNDGDVIGDNWETFYFGDLSRDGLLDFDDDGRTDLEEWQDGTNPIQADIDGDGLNDSEELAFGSDPFDADSDDDSWNDGEEFQAGTDPNSGGSFPVLAADRTDQYPTLPMETRDATVVFNEIHFHPAGDNSSLEFIEFHNQLVVDVDLSNWRLAGDIDFDFPEGTVISAGAYLVIAQNPSALEAATGHSGALGPFDGFLSNSSGNLRLYTNNRSYRSLPGGVGSSGEILDELEGRRIMDEIEYEDVSPWPIGPDGSGSTLAKIDPATGTAHQHHWTASVPVNGTPGEANLSALKPSLSINEVAATTDTNFQIELYNYGSTSISLTGMIVASSDSTHADYVLPSGTLASGAFLSIDAATLGFTPADNNRVFLYGAGRLALVDAIRADDQAIARHPDGTGRWLFPDTSTFGNPNSFSFEDAIVINEIFYHAYPEREPFAEREEEWIELYNRSASAVNLTGWKIDGGIDFDFTQNTIIPSGGYLVVAKDAAALATKHSGITTVGDYSGRLGNGGDLIVLEDAFGNPADEVRYYDSGNWYADADGGGSSLELLDPDSDNTRADAWAPSDESSRSNWQTYTYEGIAVEDGHGDNLWHELQIGLLDAGEFLIDDVSVIENGSTEFMQNGDFDGDSVGGSADKWRVIGTHGSHGQTMVVTDPDDSGNKCLRVVASGPTENKHNKIETTFANSQEVVVGQSYRISFRAKWLSGSNQLNSRLYFSFLQRTTHLEATEIWGTPGAANSVAVANAGPTFSGLSHSPVVPDANAPVMVGIDASDADGIHNLTLFYSINDGAFQSAAMTSDAAGRYTGTIPGQSASAIVRFYVRGLDSSSAESFYPSAGENGGAFYKVQDGYADTSGLRHNLRVIMSPSDEAFLYLDTNRMSNDRFPATVIVNESTVYYNVALRLKASGHGRYKSTNYGFNLRFQPDQLFRGVHGVVSIERATNYKDMLAKHLMNRAGGSYQSFYEDVAYLIPPIPNDRGVAIISMARHTSQFFDGLFPDADESGTLFNMELTYSPNGTTDGPEDLKIGNPYNITNGRYDLIDRGLDKEPYRWGFQIRSARERDDYSRLIELNQAMELTGPALKAALDPIIDVDQWMRTFAMLSLNGTDDVFGRIWEHNFRFFVRPTDQKIIALQWDLDRAFRLGANVSAVPANNGAGDAVSVARLFEIPQYRRLFDGHVQDLTENAFNSTYVTPWASHLTTLTGDNINAFTSYITSRANGVANSLPSEISFAVTSNGGVGFSISDSVVSLSGQAWVDVFSIQVNGVETEVTWLDDETWEISAPLHIGSNPLTITALNNRGTEVGSDTISITNTGTVALADASNTIISELHYHPVDPSAAEIAEGFIDDDDFEFVEITNIDPSLEVDLSNVSFSDGVTFTFPVGMTLMPGERVIVVANPAAFEFRYGAGAALIAGTYTENFRNSGEHVRLEAADDEAIADFTYGDDALWSTSADGDGYSLVFVGNDPTHELDWRSSVGIGGNPGGSDSTFLNGGDLLAYSLVDVPVGEVNGDAFVLNVRVHLAADDVLIAARFSTELENWTPSIVDDLISRINHGDGTATFSFQSPFPPSTSPRQFGQVFIQER
ncbi:lamin tail domain-containing protein [Akkermansiaceae bacterium]|nr:lamin tail domain-containing protein [Akkermansiaceae bacterium]